MAEAAAGGRGLGRVLDRSPEAALLSSWERSRALEAAPPPAEGALLPNGTGYLVALGSPAQRLHPKAARLSRWAPLGSIPAVMMTPFLMAHVPYGAMEAGLLAACVSLLPKAALRLWGGARLRWHRDAALEVTSWRDAPPGHVVRLRGVVAPQATVRSLFSDRPAVLARSEYAGVVETRGIDFRVQLADGESVYVSARDTLLVGEAPRVSGTPACGPVTVDVRGAELRLKSALLSVRGLVGRLWRLPTRELVLCPGDEVELCGTLVREPAVDGEGGPGRVAPLRTVLRPAPRFPALALPVPPGDAA